MKLLDINELMQELKYNDLRAVRKWCEKNGILITKMGKAEFVFESAFKEVIEKPFINKLRSDFGENWESVYQLYANGNIAALNTLQTMPESSSKKYKPKEPIAREYQNQFSQYAKT